MLFVFSQSKPREGQRWPPNDPNRFIVYIVRSLREKFKAQSAWATSSSPCSVADRSDVSGFRDSASIPFNILYCDLDPLVV